MKEYQLASIGQLTVGARGRKKNASEFSLKVAEKTVELPEHALALMQ